MVSSTIRALGINRRHLASNTRTTTAGLALAMLLHLTGCASGLVNAPLERVAKDWSLTIRASQVIPVYPLTEDIQPGDVFLVQTPIGKQTNIYNDRGFLPIDQLVTRLQGLDFKSFYGDAYWKGTYAATAHERPGWGSATNPPPPVLAPHAAFPTYNFEVQKDGAIRLAVPIQGVPVGLGLMGTTRAMGTVTIQDAYTYAIDDESLVRKLYAWWRSDPEIAGTLQKIVSATKSDVYLRVVNRVYLTRGVVVSLINLDAQSAGVDAGAASISLPDLSKASPEEVKSAAEAYRDALNALSSPLNNPMQPLPGGSFRFLQASRRAVTMEENFQRPLAIGYLGFDVQVYPSGGLSAPVPSFNVLTGEADHETFTKAVQ